MANILAYYFPNFSLKNYVIDKQSTKTVVCDNFDLLQSCEFYKITIYIPKNIQFI